MISVLDPTDGPPSTTGLMPCEIEGGRPCKCGHLLILARVDGVRWYWQRHGIGYCTLELPDLVCWCGLKRSEHVDGHARTEATVRDDVSCVCGHPVSHHRTGPRNQYNANQSRCAYKTAPTDAECQCQLHRDAARSSSKVGGE